MIFWRLTSRLSAVHGLSYVSHVSLFDISLLSVFLPIFTLLPLSPLLVTASELRGKVHLPLGIPTNNRNHSLQVAILYNKTFPSYNNLHFVRYPFHVSKKHNKSFEFILILAGRTCVLCSSVVCLGVDSASCSGSIVSTT